MMKNKKCSKEELIERVLALETELGRRPTKFDDNSLYFQARKYFGSWNMLMQTAGYKVRFSQKIEKVTFGKDFPYLLGLLVTDGHIYYHPPKFVKVAFYTSYPEERDFIIDLIKKLFDYNASFSSKMVSFNKKPNHEIRICSKKLAEIINEVWQVPFGAKSSIIRVPPKIMSESDYSKQLFLKGVIDGDGSITKWGIKMTSGSKLFLEDLKTLLDDLGIHSGKVVVDKPTTFNLYIHKKKDMLRFKEIYSSGPSYPRKKESFNKI